MESMRVGKLRSRRVSLMFKRAQREPSRIAGLSELRRAGNAAHIGAAARI